MATKNYNKTLTMATVFLLLVSGSPMASAVPLTWQVDANFPGCPVTGSFKFDADTNTYTDIQITTISCGSPIFGYVYADPGPRTGTPTFLSVSGPTPPGVAFSLLNLNFTPPGLTNTGGTVPIELFLEVVDVGGPAPAERDTTKGTVTAIINPVPEPNAIIYLLFGLAGLALVSMIQGRIRQRN